MASVTVEGRVAPESLQGIHPIVVVGALPGLGSEREKSDHILTAVSRGYLNNIHFIIDELGESAQIITGTTGVQEGNHAVRRAQGNDYIGWNQMVNTSSLPLSDYFHTENLDQLSYPRNILVPMGPHLTITIDSQNPLIGLIRTLDPSHTFIVDPELGIGGRYVGHETGTLTFVGIPQVPERETKINLLRKLLPTKTVVPLPLPDDLGITDFKRVTAHLDQFIAHSLPSTDSKRYVVVIDEQYQSALQQHNIALPVVTRDGRHIDYVSVSHSYTGANYLLNTIGSPTGHVFIEPELAYVLRNADVWNDLDHAKIRIMPSNIAASQDTQGGSGCKIVILAA